MLLGPPVLLLAAIGEPTRPADGLSLILLAIIAQIVGHGLILDAVLEVSPLIVAVMPLVQSIVSGTIVRPICGERLGRATSPVERPSRAAP